LEDRPIPILVTARHTLFDSSVTTPAINVTMINPLVGDPAFKDPAANDFHLKPTSAARDAGTANFVTTTMDIDGDPRIIGSAPDIGADEFNPATDSQLLYLPLIKEIEIPRRFLGLPRPPLGGAGLRCELSRTLR
jgi:hypothetical protein